MFSAKLVTVDVSRFAKRSEAKSAARGGWAAVSCMNCSLTTFFQRGSLTPSAEPMKTIVLHSPSGLTSPVIVYAVLFADIRK